MNGRRRIRVATGAALLVALFGLGWVLARGGLIAWSALLVGAGLALKSWRKPAAKDFVFVITYSVGALAFGLAVHFYVIAQWESGEVVELLVETDRGVRSARLWVFDIESVPTVYYDAEPAVAQVLRSGRTVRLIRGNEETERVPQAVPLATLERTRANRLRAAMASKYGHLEHAATLRFGVLGRGRDRVALVVALHRPALR